jgi:hypothetical protein
MAGARRKKKPQPLAEMPTPEQLAQGTWRRTGMAYRRTPVIDTLFAEHKITQRQFDGLKRYRDVAIADERSPIRDSLDMTPRGIGSDIPPSAVRVAIELARLERALGSLTDVARAIAVDDRTLSQYAASQHGAAPVKRRGVVRFEPTKFAYDRALLDIRMAGIRIAAEIGA